MNFTYHSLAWQRSRYLAPSGNRRQPSRRLVGPSPPFQWLPTNPLPFSTSSGRQLDFSGLSTSLALTHPSRSETHYLLAVLPTYLPSCWGAHRPIALIMEVPFKATSTPGGVVDT